MSETKIRNKVLAAKTFITLANKFLACNHGLQQFCKRVVKMFNS